MTSASLGEHRRDEKNLFQWTAIDECARVRFAYGYDEHTPENSVDFLERFLAWFPFEVYCVQTDNGAEITYLFISDTVKCPFVLKLAELGITTNSSNPTHLGTTAK